MKKWLFIIYLLFSSHLFAQQTKTLNGRTYPISDQVIGQFYSKLVTMDGSIGVLKTYAKIKEDSLFITNEFYQASTLWKVEYARIKIDSLVGEREPWLADTILAENKGVYGLILYGNDGAGVYHRFSAFESFDYLFRSILIFFESKRSANDFMKKLR